MEDVRRNVEALGFRVKLIAGDNPLLRPTRIPFVFPKYGCTRLRELRRRFGFAGVASSGVEFTDLIRLAEWVNGHLHREGRVVNVADPIEILGISAAKGAAFWCSHFAIVYSACAAALGLPVRALGVDSLHRRGENSTHHGTCEAYSTKLRKWFLVDPMHGMYYLKEGTPLSVYELGCEWQANKGRDVCIITFDGKQIARSGKHVIGRQHESSAYHFFYTPLMIDPFPSAGGGEPDRLLYFEDQERQKHVWYQGGANNSHPHIGYRGDFLPTDRVDDFYFDLNLVHMQTRPLPGRGVLGVRFATFTPNLSHFLYRVDKGVWRRFSGRRPWKEEEARYLDAEGDAANPGRLQQNEVAWEIHKGLNVFAVKPVNRFGREGAVSHIRVRAG